MVSRLKKKKKKRGPNPIIQLLLLHFHDKHELFILSLVRASSRNPKSQSANASTSIATRHLLLSSFIIKFVGFLYFVNIIKSPVFLLYVVCEQLFIFALVEKVKRFSLIFLIKQKSHFSLLPLALESFQPAQHLMKPEWKYLMQLHYGG